MIIIRAPLRISFVGGGTDLPGFYEQYIGRVLSVTIDKFIYLAIKPVPLVNDFILKYQTTEIVKHPKEFKNDRVREALLDYGIVNNGIEIASFADIPAKTGLGSSSSFSVALMMGLSAFLGKKISKEYMAEEACRLEIDILKEPIGKQDQYATAFGGFNIFQFNKGGRVDTEPIFLDFKKQHNLERHTLLFFTGISRPASSVLKKQSDSINNKIEIYKEMSDSVLIFKEKLLASDIRGMAEILNDGWTRKKKLAPNISSSLIDTMLDLGIEFGAWGGKVLGAGGGGCILFLATPEKHEIIRKAVSEHASNNNLLEFMEIPVKFTKLGASVLFDANRTCFI